MLLAFAAIFVLLATIVGRNLSAVEALLNGGLDFGDGLGRFPLSLPERLVAGDLVLGIFGAGLGLQYQLSWHPKQLHDGQGASRTRASPIGRTR